jgi:hypothetical protein
LGARRIAIPGFEHQDSRTGLRQSISRHSAGHTGANDDDIEIALHGLS